MTGEFTVFAGTANPALASAIADELGVRLGVCAIDRFPDGEISVRIDEPVRRRDVFVIQPTAPPVNDHLIELLAFADACRRAAAARITAIVPYLGYARSDKRHGRREAITASLVALLMQTSGIDHVVTMDLHAAQIEGFFHIPVDSLSAVPTLCEALRDRLPEDTIVVSPDTGRVAMATEYAHRLDTTVAVLHKRRESGTATAVTHVVGEVRDRPCLIIDDMISTGGTIASGVGALLQAGARAPITVAATHGLLIEGSRPTLSGEGIGPILVTDTVPVVAASWPALRVVSAAPVLAAAIRRLVANGSLGELV